MALHIPQEIQELYPEAVEIYRNLHKTPELLYDLPITSAFVASYLQGLGFEVQEKVGISGVVAILHGEGPMILFRADMDALPITEETDLSYKSLTPGRMHACGHDGHITMLLLAAKVLSRNKALKGSIKFVFQPAEEGGAGAKAMRDDGVLEGVAEVYGLHLASPMNLGDYLSNDLYMSCNSDRFQVTVKGKGGHGSAPHKTIDPIPITAQLILAFNGLATNNLGTVRIATTIVNTSETFNAIPTVCNIQGCVRSMHLADRENIQKRMREICKGIGNMHKAVIDLEYFELYGAVKNNPECNKFAVNAMKKTTDGKWIQREIMIGEDFSYFSDVRPGNYILIGCADLASPSMHSSKFQINEEVLLIGITYWVNLALERLS